MSDQTTDRVTTAATAVMKALESLSPEERVRVIESAAALYGIRAGNRMAMADPNDEGSVAKQDTEPARNGQETQRLGLEKRMSIVELLKEKQPATNSQRIATFAFFREQVEGKPRFSRSDLEPYFSSAKLSKPANYDRDFAGAVREGWIHEEAGASYLTQGGEDAVREGFAGKGKPRGVSVARKKNVKGNK